MTNKIANTKHLKPQVLSFNGSILNRGFWLYVWHIRLGRSQFLYVGRTGDSSSVHAASPFSRLSRHLDDRPNAAANMIIRHIEEKNLDLLRCSYKMIAIGPLFPEQTDRDRHRKCRDIVASLEGALANYLNLRYNVVGSHPQPRSINKTIIDPLCKAFIKALSEDTC